MTKIAELLAMNPSLRTPEVYEAMYDEYIESAGGCRVDSTYTIPVGKKNADYRIESDFHDVLLELKQLTKYVKSDTVSSYFAGLLAAEKVIGAPSTTSTSLRISPASLSHEEWNRFYQKYRPSVETSLRKAAVQLRETDEFMTQSSKRRLKGVVFLNSGDYNLPTDLLFRLVESKVKREWKEHKFKSIDFVACVTVDMYCPETHPLHSRHIARSLADRSVVDTIRQLHEKWLSYVACGFGHEVKRAELDATPDAPREIPLSFAGKIQWKAE